jgi:hypothetical protein
VVAARRQKPGDFQVYQQGKQDSSRLIILKIYQSRLLKIFL